MPSGAGSLEDKSGSLLEETPQACSSPPPPSNPIVSGGWNLPMPSVGMASWYSVGVAS